MTDRPEAEPDPVERLAVEFVAQSAEPAGSGGAPSLDEFLERLTDDDERLRFRALIDQAELARQSVPRRNWPGRVVAGRYRVENQIGSGGMGRVFSAWDEQLGRRVALKVLSAVDVGDPERESLLFKESRQLAALQHPNIVAVHEAGRDGELVYVVMDLVDGLDLAHVIERASSLADGTPTDASPLIRAIGRSVPVGREDLIEPASWPRTVARILLEMTRTLEAAHARGIVHRDLKPGNVLLTGGGNPVLLDFGLSGSTDASAGTITRGLYGTVAYLAPEQIESARAGNDPRSDLYQVGLLLYELLTLRRAFDGEGVGEVLLDIRLGEVTPPRGIDPSLPRDLEAICMKAIEVSPDRRYANAGELREDLERFLGGEELPRAVEGSTGRAAARHLRRFCRRHPVWIGVAGVVLAGLLAWRLSPDTLVRAEELGAFRLGPGATELASLEWFEDEVGVGDLLGVHVDAAAEAHLYALSVWGGADPDARYVRPLEPMELEAWRADEPRPAGWGLALDAGPQAVVCTMLDDTSLENEYEGLWVFTADREEPVIEAWFEALEELPDAAFFGVSVEAARRTFEAVRTGESTRGGGIDALPPEERARYGELSADAVRSQASWSLEGVRRWELWARVRPEG